MKTTHICYGMIVIIVILLFLMQLYYKEGFQDYLPKNVKKMSRPIVRNIRINYEGFISNSKLNLSNMFRKLGLM